VSDLHDQRLIELDEVNAAFYLGQDLLPQYTDNVLRQLIAVLVSAL